MTDEQMTQRELIRRIFVLKDLHVANYGVDANGRLSIADFKVFFSLLSLLLVLFRSTTITAKSTNIGRAKIKLSVNEL